MIQVKNLSKSFDRCKALDNTNLNVKKSSVYGLVGPNGSGKTTLIKHLAGVLKQDSGIICIDGQPVFDNPQVKKRMVYLPEDVCFFFQYSIEDMARFYKKAYASWDQERYEKLKRAFPIDTSCKIRRLSKGMKKQAAFWLGISIMPQLFILDEPVDGLDPVIRKQVLNLLIQDTADSGTTVLISSHNLRELEDICDCVGIMHHGRVVVENDLDEIKSHVHKIQTAFPGNIPGGLLEGIEVLDKKQNGSVFLLVVKGEIQEIMSRLRKANPSILDVVSLSLEEIFIYELGGKGYGIENIII